MEFIKDERQVVVLLMGIPASGKSTFCGRYLSHYMRINLDTLKTRHRETIALEDAFANNQSVVVDNTNVTKAEREKYINMAKEKSYAVAGFFFQSNVKSCVVRNNEREREARVPAKAIAAKSNQLEIPNYDEGFDRLYYVRIADNDFEITDWKTE
ncbi:MAG: AAA family ATPase [Muribaculaceae bacterium]|nr:AAA family ATPase [Muribaculaceae bacterium]